MQSVKTGAELQGGPCGPRTTLRSGQPRRIGTVGTGESACVPLSLLRSAFPPMPIASDCAPSFPCGCAVSHRILLCACGAAVGAGDVATASTAIGHRQLHELQWKTRSSSPAGTRTSESSYEDSLLLPVVLSFSHVHSNFWCSVGGPSCYKLINKGLE